MTIGNSVRIIEKVQVALRSGIQPERTGREEARAHLQRKCLRPLIAAIAPRFARTLPPIVAEDFRRDLPKDGFKRGEGAPQSISLRDLFSQAEVSLRAIPYKTPLDLFTMLGKEGCCALIEGLPQESRRELLQESCETGIFTLISFLGLNRCVRLELGSLLSFNKKEIVIGLAASGNLPRE